MTFEDILQCFIFVVAQLCVCQAASVSETSLPWNSDVAKLSVVLVSVCVLVVLSVYVLLNCTDCYNSEVDSTSHPACGGGKMGSAGYNPANMNDVNAGVMQSSYTTNEYVTPGSAAPLPYSMITSPIAEQGFVGYNTSAQGTATGYVGYGAGTAGYGGGTAGYAVASPSAPPGGANRARSGSHVNPMEPEEPPPSYGEAVQTYG